MLLNRRHLRIKALQTLYSFSQQGDVDFAWAKKEMMTSIGQMQDLYIMLLQIFVELKKKAELRIEENRNKHLPTEEDIYPNLKFVDNQIIKILEEHPELKHQSDILKANWKGDVKQELMRKLFNHVQKSETYFEFMNNEQDSFNDDKEFMVQLFKNEVANFHFLLDYFEEKSVYWLDDIDLMCSMVIKTIKKFEEGEDADNSIFPLFKPNDDEKEFIIRLLKETIDNREENLELIEGLTKNWELDRIAKMDVLLMELAITELVVFENIPERVTLNEYIEISKFYSTPKSNIFINGILDKAVQQLNKKGKISKEGRGLIN